MLRARDPPVALDALLNRWDTTIATGQRRNLFRVIRAALLVSRGRPAAADSIYATLSPPVRASAELFGLVLDLAGAPTYSDIARTVAVVELSARDSTTDPADVCAAALWRTQRRAPVTLTESQKSRSTCRWALDPLTNMNDTSVARTAVLEVADSIVRNSLQNGRGYEPVILARLWEGNGKPVFAPHRSLTLDGGRAGWNIPVRLCQPTNSHMKRILIVTVLAATASQATAQANSPVTVKLSEWKIAIPRDTVQAGAVTFRVTNEGGMNHALYVRGEGVDKGTREITMRQSASLTVTLKPGTYELFCPMSDESHKLAGMKRTLVVTPGASQAGARKPGG